jgi:hypothetical protein
MAVIKMYLGENSKYSTGNSVVDKIGNMNITGNVIPASWYKTIVNKNGKPNLNAIVILADIVYWYRPTEIRDEVTGQLVGMKKKFRSDKLQKSYGQFVEHFKLSKQQVTDAVVFLEKIGVINREFRSGVVNGQKYVNLLYIDIVPQILYKLTYPEDNPVNDTASNEESKVPESDTTSVPNEGGVGFESDTPSVSNGGGVGFESDTLSASNEGMSTETDTLSVLKGTGVGLNMDTNTYNTKEISNRDYDYSINQSIVKKEINIDEIDRWREIIKDNIEYEALISQDNKNDIGVVDELVELITEMVAINKHTVRINGNDIPSEVVKSRFLKLNYLEFTYVLETLSKNNTKINNIRAYLLTTLYNSKSTMKSYYTAEVNHDLYGT